MTASVAFADAIARAIVGWLVTYAVHSTILLGMAALVSVRLREQPAWLDWCWKVALVGAVVTTTLQSVVRLQPLGGRWTPVSAVTASVQQSGAARNRADRATARAIEPGQAIETRNAVECCSAEAASEVRQRPVTRSMAAWLGAPRGFLRKSWPLLVVGIWSICAVVGVVRFAWRQRTLYRLLRDRRWVEDVRVTRAFDELCAAGGVRWPLRLTATARCPVPIALLGGEIVVPDRLLSELDPEQQRAALAHEVAHQRRRDPLWLLVVHVLEAVFLFQPLQRRARHELREAAEVLCDDWAVQQTVSIGVARCLATVAAWVSPGREWQLTAASGMACSDSALLRRVERVLRSQRVAPPRRALAAATLLSVPLLSMTAPVISLAAIPASAKLPLQVATRFPAPAARVDGVPSDAQAWLQSADRQANQERVIRPPRPAAALEARWAWALEEAARRRLSAFHVVYSFYRPVQRDQQFISDSHGVNFSDDVFRMSSLRTVLDGTDPIGGRGTIGVLFHFTSRAGRRIDRIGHRSLNFGFDFADEPVFWLGYAAERESLERLERVFHDVPSAELRGEVVEAYGVHPTTDRVLPFLTRVLQREQHEELRAEAAESLEHHADARVVPLLVRAARSDPAEVVRVEAAEALGAVDVGGAVPALVELAKHAADPRVRAEAAEALGEQAPDRALPALQQVIAGSADSHVVAEAVEALGDLQTEGAVAALVRIIWGNHPPGVQREAVEALGAYREHGILEQLNRIVAEHDNEQVVGEALDVLGELNDPRAEQRVARAARTSPSPLVRREALEWLGDAHERGSTRPGGLSAEQLMTLLERVIFEDSDRSVQLEALDVAAESLPRAAARRLLRRVADEHPVRSVRQEALELLADIT
jgi:HEAT repeat protein/beta-lactamase regulating signal transducer with metallopeptidase domain